MTTSLNVPFRVHGMQWLFAAALIGLYVFLDWVSYIDPLFRLNITPWNPDLALGLVCWLRFGKRTAVPWFFAMFLSEFCVRGMPAGPWLTALLSAWLVAGYGALGEVLRRMLADLNVLQIPHGRLPRFVILVFGLVVNSMAYIVLLRLVHLIPAGSFGISVVQFSIGDIVGVIMTMPVMWMIGSRDGRRSLKAVLAKWETAGYVALALFLIWGVFYSVIGTNEFKHFYFLFLPIVWAATRQGLAGTALIAFVVQFAIICVVRWGKIGEISFAELQLLGAALALVGYFIGALVDEQREAAVDLKNSLRLAAASEMAAAIAHELNQPMTALSAYGRACKHLLARGDTGTLLTESIGKMVLEAERASEVVKRLREFFRSGAIELERTGVRDIVAAVAQQFEVQCAQHQVHLDLMSVPDLEIRADRLQIELVLRNLIANAFDAVLTRPPGNRCITVTGASLQGGRVRMEVKDSGPGIPHSIAERLFDPFVSGKSSGLGLGLALSRAIVVAHGGTLWAEAGDRGLFIFVLPLIEPGVQHVK